MLIQFCDIDGVLIDFDDPDVAGACSFVVFGKQ